MIFKILNVLNILCIRYAQYIQYTSATVTMNSTIRILITSAIMIAICVIIGTIAFLFSGASIRAKHAGVILISSGDSVSKVANSLYDKSIIENKEVFTQYARVYLKLHGQKYHIGEYKIDKGNTARDIMRKITSHDYFMRSVLVPEGLTNYQVGRILDDAVGLEGDMPTNIEEGYLMPDTYFYTSGTTKAEIAKRMQTSMNDFLDEAWESRNMCDEITNKRDALILASIIELESALDKERERIGGVFINRLRIGMRLQTDPSVVYALSGGRGKLSRPLTHKDYGYLHPFNTYKNKGLTPTAICNPSRLSILAALHPEKNNYLYFVTKKDSKEHEFSARFDEHVVNRMKLKDGYVDEKRAVKIMNNVKTQTEQIWGKNATATKKAGKRNITETGIPMPSQKP